MKLTKLGSKTYVLESPVNIGIYLLNDREVCIIDTGNSKESGKEIAKVLEENNWHLKYIINTHSHADHIGGNAYLQRKYNCEIFSSQIESYFINNPELEPATLYGASPIKELCHSFLMAKPSICRSVNEIKIDGIEIIDLKGHSLDNIGIVTSDNVCFVGDAYTSAEIISKYSIQYTFDVIECLNTLKKLNTTHYSYYVPAHGQIEKEPYQTILANENALMDLECQILSLIDKEVTYNYILNSLFNINHIKSSIEQYHIIGVTVKSMLTKLIKEEKIEMMEKDGTLWLRKK